MSAKTEDTIRAFLNERFNVSFDKSDVTPETNLIEAGIVDSYGMIELAAFIEGDFNIRLTDEQMSSPLLASLNGMCEIVESNGASK